MTNEASKNSELVGDVFGRDVVWCVVVLCLLMADPRLLWAQLTGAAP